MNMISEALMLPFQITGASKIIQAGFADTDYIVRLAEGNQIIHAGIYGILDIRMHTGGYGNFGIPGCQFQHCRIGFQINGNAEEVLDMAVFHVVHKTTKVVLIRRQIKTIQMAVRIDKHEF